MHTADNARVQGYVGNIFKASERAKGLVEQILTFTRQGKSQKVPCDIAIVLKEVVKLLRASIPSTIEIVQKIPSNLGTVLADQTQIHQVLMNLCTNAAHAPQALERFTSRPDEFDLVITDMTMPAMTGDQLATQILNHRPDIPVIICTGFSKRISPEMASSLGIRALLMKPVSVQELARTIREVLDQPAS
ncbi:MAG: response regulator [Desulfosarcina sp.]|nr:response regulator [Desulfosarcina sp.]